MEGSLKQACSKTAQMVPLEAYLELKEENKVLRSIIKKQEDTIHQLQEQVKLLQAALFGKKSERLDSSLDEKQVLEEPLTEVSSYKRRKGVLKAGRLIDTSKLLRYQLIHDIENKLCPDCGGPLKPAGEDVSEQLENIPQSLYVVEHCCKKWSCKPCHKILTAQKTSPAPLPKALAGASLLAQVCVNKYQHHLPLYRQSKIYKSQQIDIPDNTLGHWVWVV